MGVSQAAVAVDTVLTFWESSLSNAVLSIEELIHAATRSAFSCEVEATAGAGLASDQGLCHGGQ